MIQLAVFISASFTTPLGFCGIPCCHNSEKTDLVRAMDLGCCDCSADVCPTYMFRLTWIKPVLAAPSVQGIKLFMTAPLQGNSRCGDPRILQLERPGQPSVMSLKYLDI